MPVLDNEEVAEGMIVEIQMQESAPVNRVDERNYDAILDESPVKPAAKGQTDLKEVVARQQAMLAKLREKLNEAESAQKSDETFVVVTDSQQSETLA